ncbi:hypothetical protein, partial [Vibrio parahaemolyticus]
GIKKTKQTHINQSFSMEEVAAHLNLLANSLGMYSMLFLLWSHNAALRGSNALPPNLNLPPKTQIPRFEPNSPRVDCPS